MVTWSMRQKIISEQWNNPEKTEVEIAKEFNITRDVVRGTLKPLYSLGILERAPHYYATHRPSDEASV